MKRKGFTLIEMIIAIGIFLAILGVFFFAIHCVLKSTEIYVRQNLKQQAYNQIYIGLRTIENSINVVPDYNTDKLWFQLPQVDNGELQIPLTNGAWYFLELKNNQIYKINFINQEEILLSPIDIYIDNTTFDFDEAQQSVRITCDIWHIRDDRAQIQPFRANFILNLLNPLGVFEEEEVPI